LTLALARTWQTRASSPGLFVSSTVKALIWASLSCLNTLVTVT
jgi:hypothetical protein